MYIRKPDKCPSPNCTFKIVFCFSADCKDTNHENHLFMLKSLIIIKQNENVTKTSQLAN